MPYERGRHDRHTTQHQAARYSLRKGMARMALAHKTGKQQAMDSRGAPMRYAVEMAERHGVKKLQAWANGATVVGLAMSINQQHPKAARWP